MLKRKILVSFFVLILLSSAIPLPDYVKQSDQNAAITNPIEGQVLSGIFDIIGTSEITDFAYSEIAFSNIADPNEAWFQISKSLKSVNSDLLYAWDTTGITDGDYRLRLRVYSNDDLRSEFVVSLISIRNYTPTTVPLIPATIFPLGTTATGVVATETQILEPTRLPENPLSLSSGDVAKSLIYGLLTILGLIGISFFYSQWHHK